MSSAMARHRKRALGALAVALVVFSAGACRSPSAEAVPSAESDPARPAPPVGFRNVEADGWSIDLPPEFTPDVDGPPESSMIWLVHQRDDRTPGAASVLFARHAKPAEFSSRVFGLTALHGLRKSAGKKVVSSRQHTVGGIEVTDIEVQVGSDSEGRRQWRRLLVYENVAYTLTYSVRSKEAERHRARAEAVLRSLYHPPKK